MKLKDDNLTITPSLFGEERRPDARERRKSSLRHAVPKETLEERCVTSPKTAGKETMGYSQTYWASGGLTRITRGI